MPELRTETMTVNMGPQHPSTHGVLNIVVQLSGETIVKADTTIGFLHTGIEKTAEQKKWQQVIPLVERMDYLGAQSNSLAFCLSVERLLGVEGQMPERVKNIRILLVELQRISSHLVSLGTHALEVGAVSVLMYCLSDRERILNIYAHTGFDGIDGGDLRGRFRWMGLYTQRAQGIPGGKTATLEPEELEDSYFMMRVRTDGGALTSQQLRVIAGISTDFGRDVASLCVLLVAVFPGGLWLSAVYSEALFLLLSVGAIYAARTDRWAWAGIAGALAASTRASPYFKAEATTVRRQDCTTCSGTPGRCFRSRARCSRCLPATACAATSSSAFPKISSPASCRRSSRNSSARTLRLILS